ncbi:MAG: DUF2169 domain-containing protein, partial [Polyangiaceae bacterium]|nr:DUF2169 domain-containing protein [Polyangiaceae bacterium]
LPEDFDPRFFHGAPVDQTTPRPLRGGERLHATGVRPGGVPVDIVVPRRELRVTATLRGEPLDCPVSLDTLVLEPDDTRLGVCWRAVVPCGRHLLYVDRVEVRDDTRA